MRILVTGGAGFIGSNFVHYMLNIHPDNHIVVLDKLTYAGNLDNLKGFRTNRNFRFVKGDICDRNVVERLVRNVDCVINFAAETHVDRSIWFAGDFVRTDVFGTFVLLEAVRKNGKARFVQISTDEVYGEAGERPSSEDAPLMPKSPYAASKAGADRLAYSYHTTYGTPVVITRCTNNYGPYQFPEKLIPLFVTNALRDRKLPVYGSGKNTRDWIHVMDHCRAIDAVLHAGTFSGDVFNIGAGEEHSVLEIAQVVLDTIGKSSDMLEYVADRPGHVTRHAVDTNKIRNRLGWAPVEKFTKGIRETVHWYMENEWWWKKLLSKQMDFTKGPPRPKGTAKRPSGKKPAKARPKPHPKRRR